MLLIVTAILNVYRTLADRYAGKNVDHPAFALLEWPTPMLAILSTAFVAWSDFQSTVGYARFQIDDPNSIVTLTSDDSRLKYEKRGGMRKLRVPEGKYYWTVSDPGILDDHAANGTVDIESPRTSVIDAIVHRGNALERSEGYWRCVSTDSVLNGGGVEGCEWARSPGWIAIDKQFIVSWDASGNLIGNWSLKRNADSSPKTLEIVDILTGDSLAEGQWAVSQKKLLLRLYPPRKTTLPYLSSIFSKPTNGDLLEWRFDKLSGPPAWLNSASLGESAAPPVEIASDTERPTETDSADPNLDGRWILDSVYIGPDSFVSRGTTGEVIFAGGWLLTVQGDGTITKGIVTTRTDVNPKQIRIESTSSEEGAQIVMHGIYRVDDKSRRFRNLEVYFLQPGFELASTDGEFSRLSETESNKAVQEAIGALTERCFDEPPEAGQILWRGRLSLEHGTTVPLPPKVDGIILDTKQSGQNGRKYVEVSIGKVDGLKEGHILHVYRTGDSEEKIRIGKIRLQLVTPDRAVGVLVERQKGKQVEVEDRVTTDLH